MDADVMITIAFCLEVLLFALAGGLFVAHEVGKTRSRGAVETGRERLELAATRTRPIGSASANESAAEAAQPITARTGRPGPGLRP
jgi:hypothetical protein